MAGHAIPRRRFFVEGIPNSEFIADPEICLTPFFGDSRIDDVKSARIDSLFEALLTGGNEIDIRFDSNHVEPKVQVICGVTSIVHTYVKNKIWIHAAENEVRVKSDLKVTQSRE